MLVTCQNWMNGVNLYKMETQLVKPCQRMKGKQFTQKVARNKTFNSHNKYSELKEVLSFAYFQEHFAKDKSDKKVQEDVSILNTHLVQQLLCIIFLFSLFKNHAQGTLDLLDNVTYVRMVGLDMTVMSVPSFLVLRQSAPPVWVVGLDLTVTSVM